MTTSYNSGGVPFAGFFVDIYRPADPAASNPGSDTKLGRYLVESLTPSDSSVLVKRPGTDGGKNGWFIVDGDTEGSATIQRNISTTPSLKNGDYFDAAVRVGADGVAVAERFVIHSPAHQVDPGYRKQSVSVIVDTNGAGISSTSSQSAS